MAASPVLSIHGSINDLTSSGLFPVAKLMEQAGDRQKNEHLLSRLVGFLMTSSMRPNVLILFKTQNLPHPRELTVYENSEVEEIPFGNSAMVRVSSYIWRSTVDDTYVFHLSPQREFFLVIRGFEPCPLLRSEALLLVHQLSSQPDFPLYLWRQGRLKREVHYYQQKGLSCVYYGRNWSVELTFCEDHVVRITGWTGMPAKVTWDTGTSFVITRATPALVFRPTRSKNAFSTTIDVVHPWQELLSAEAHQ